MVLKVFTDGGAKGNPGPASVGIVIYQNSQEMIRYREDIGVSTNNVAEYTAVLRALELIKEQKSNINPALARQISNIHFYSDSQLLVSQLNGIYKVKNARIREFIMKIRILEQEVGSSITYHHIPREKNQVADDLVNNKS